MFARAAHKIKPLSRFEQALRLLERKCLGERLYATRGQFDSPFDHLPKRAPKPWFNWKTTTVFFLGGAFLAYNETLFNFYAKYTDTSGDDGLAVKRLEYEMKNLPIYERLAHPKKGENWVQMSSWENLDRNPLEGKAAYKKKAEDEYSQPALTNSTLAQKGGIAVEPVIFHNLDTDEGVAIIHVGYRLCGYPLLIHGGILATLINETLKRTASLSQHTTSDVKGDFKVEDLSMSYKYPTFANQFLVIKTKVVDIDHKNPKTVNLTSLVESQNGKTLVKSEARLVDTGRELKAMIKANGGGSRWWPW